MLRGLYYALLSGNIYDYAKGPDELDQDEDEPVMVSIEEARGAWEAQGIKIGFENMLDMYATSFIMRATVQVLRSPLDEEYGG